MATNSSLVQDVSGLSAYLVEPALMALVDQYATGTHPVTLSQAKVIEDQVVKTKEVANCHMSIRFKTVELSTFDYLVRTFFMVITLGISRAVLNDQFRTAVFAGNFQYAANVIKLGAAGDVLIEDLCDLANEGNTDALEFLFAQNTDVYTTYHNENDYRPIFTRICEAVRALRDPNATGRLSMQGVTVALRTLLKYSHRDFSNAFDGHSYEYDRSLFNEILSAEAYEVADIILDHYPALKDQPFYLRQTLPENGGSGLIHNLSRWQYLKGKQAPTSELLEEAWQTNNPEIFEWALNFSATHFSPAAGLFERVLGSVMLKQASQKMLTILLTHAEKHKLCPSASFATEAIDYASRYHNLQMMQQILNTGAQLTPEAYDVVLRSVIVEEAPQEMLTTLLTHAKEHNLAIPDDFLTQAVRYLSESNNRDGQIISDMLDAGVPLTSEVFDHVLNDASLSQLNLGILHILMTHARAHNYDLDSLLSQVAKDELKALQENVQNWTSQLAVSA